MIEAGGGVHVGVAMLDEGLELIGDDPVVPDAALVEELQASDMVETSIICAAKSLRTAPPAGTETETLPPVWVSVKRNYRWPTGGTESIDSGETQALITLDSVGEGDDVGAALVGDPSSWTPRDLRAGPRRWRRVSSWHGPAQRS